MLNGGQIGVKSRPEGPSHVSPSPAAPKRRARVTLLYRPVAQVPLVRSRPDREYKLLHDVLQPEFVRQIIKVEFHGAHPPDALIIASFAFYVATGVPFHNPLTAQALLEQECLSGIRITHRCRTKMACQRLSGQSSARPGVGSMELAKGGLDGVHPRTSRHQRSRAAVQARPFLPLLAGGISRTRSP